MPVTVRRRLRDKYGLLKAYLVVVKQDGAEDFDTEIPYDQVRMHLTPGSRVRINQEPPVAVSSELVCKRRMMPLRQHPVLLRLLSSDQWGCMVLGCALCTGLQLLCCYHDQYRLSLSSSLSSSLLLCAQSSDKSQLDMTEHKCTAQQQHDLAMPLQTDNQSAARSNSHATADCPAITLHT